MHHAVAYACLGPLNCTALGRESYSFACWASTHALMQGQVLLNSVALAAASHVSLLGQSAVAQPGRAKLLGSFVERKCNDHSSDLPGRVLVMDKAEVLPPVEADGCIACTILLVAKPNSLNSVGVGRLCSEEVECSSD